jgi:hypothetical protein
MLRTCALRTFVTAGMAVLVWWGACASASAQGFRVFTRVSHETSGVDPHTGRPRRPEVIARTLSLFHAGKVYDYIEAVGEVIVFEPANRRFTVLSVPHSIAATVEFDELKNLMKVARHETESYLDRLRETGDPASLQMVAPIEFQLDPRFDEHFDPAAKRLSLASRYVRYEVACAEPPTPEAAETYLRYADWI